MSAVSMGDWRLDEQALIFDLTAEQAEELMRLVEAGQFEGRVEVDHPAFLRYREAVGAGNAPALLVYSTDFLARASLSCARYFRAMLHEISRSAVVAVRNESLELVALTRQDEEGRILEVLWERGA